MTQRRAEKKARRYVALVGCCLLLARFAEAQDVSTNEVLPSTLKAKATVNSTLLMLSRAVVCPSEPPHTLARILGVGCKTNADCQFLGPEQRCCRGMCRKGHLFMPPVYEPPHGDFLGVRRKCPETMFPENLPVKRCSKDSDCESFNRICCPDQKDQKLYCRTASPIWSQLPIPPKVDPFKTLVGFVQCQPAPPPVLDIFSRPCNRTMDCLPNLCCQEGSKKVCRPAKRSVLSLAVQATSRFIKG